MEKRERSLYYIVKYASAESTRKKIEKWKKYVYPFYLQHY